MVLFSKIRIETLKIKNKFFLKKIYLWNQNWKIFKFVFEPKPKAFHKSKELSNTWFRIYMEIFSCPLKVPYES